MSVPDDPTEILEEEEPRDRGDRVPTLRTLALGEVAALLVAVLPAALERPPFLGTLAIVGSLALVVLSGVGAAVGWRHSRARGAEQLRPALSGVFVGALLLDVLAVVVALTVLSTGFRAALALGGAVGALVLFWVALPLTVGAWVASRLLAPVRYVFAAWPAASLVGFLVFVAPGPGGTIDFARYNVLFLDDPTRSLLLLVIAAVVVAGPAVALAVLVWVRRRG